jgi:HlyD family secretion protein
LDPAPQYVVPASVSFVAADARFTPKNVETADEREKLMFRVELKVDARVLKEYSRKVKTSVRGVGIVLTTTGTAWPEDLKVKLLR